MSHHECWGPHSYVCQFAESCLKIGVLLLLLLLLLMAVSGLIAITACLLNAVRLFRGFQFFFSSNFRLRGRLLPVALARPPPETDVIIVEDVFKYHEGTPPPRFKTCM